MKYLKIASVIATIMVLVACGGASNRDELAAAGTPAVLYSTAPSALTVVASAPASPFTIGGGTPPYSASSSNASVATATVSGSSLNIAGGLVGNATVLILDSKGARVEIALTVSSPQAAPTLRTTAPSDITLAVGATNSFSIFGGTPPYLTSSSNASVVTRVSAATQSPSLVSHAERQTSLPLTPRARKFPLQSPWAPPPSHHYLPLPAVPSP